MWLETPQKWQTGTNLGTSVFLTANLVSDFGFCVNKEQFGLIWPTTLQKWQTIERIKLGTNQQHSL